MPPRLLLSKNNLLLMFLVAACAVNETELADVVHKDYLSGELGAGIGDHSNLKIEKTSGVRKYKVLVHSLNVRSGSGKNYQVIGIVRKSDVIRGIKIDGWLKLDSGGFVSMKYLDIVPLNRDEELLNKVPVVLPNSSTSENKDAQKSAETSDFMEGNENEMSEDESSVNPFENIDNGHGGS